MKAYFRRTLCLLVWIAVTVTGCGSDSLKTTATSDVLYWNAVALNIIRAEMTVPPLAARNLAMIHTAIFDALVAVSKKYQPYHYHPTASDLAAVNPMVGASQTALVAAAAHKMLLSLYPNHSGDLDPKLVAALAGIPDDAKAPGVLIGEAAATSIFSLRQNDSGLTGPAAPATAPGVWIPTPPKFLAPLLPGWGQLTPFTMTSSSQFRQAGPPLLTDASYATDFEQTRTLGSSTSSARTADQTAIAKFWADGMGTETPPGHWNTITGLLAEAASLGALETARVFALVNLSLADAGISCWDMKYQFWGWRPITAIPVANTMGNAGVTQDPSWEPLLTTPNFPEYPSGHSTFSAAAARTLSHYFGTDSLSFTVGSDGLPGVTRTFTSLSAAAEEAGLSRIYGGIHFNFSNRDGATAGNAIGDQVAAGFLQPL